MIKITITQSRRQEAVWAVSRRGIKTAYASNETNAMAMAIELIPSPFRTIKVKTIRAEFPVKMTLEGWL